jgi:hypothetical protein
MRKWSLKYWLLKWQIHRDETFLLEKAFLKAKSEGIEINIGAEYICTLQEKKGRIYLPPAEGGVDVKNLLALIVDDYPEVITRWFNNGKKLYG